MRMFRVSSLATGLLAALVAATLLSGLARSQVNASPSWVPIGVSASGTASTAWFHEPSSRQTVACRTAESPAGAPLTIQCVAGKLP